MKFCVGRFRGDFQVTESTFGFKIPVDGYGFGFVNAGERTYDVFEDGEKIARFACSGKHFSVVSTTGEKIISMNEAALEEADDATCCCIAASVLAHRNEK